MKKMEELKDILCEELDKIAGKGSITKADLENAHMLSDTIKNLDKIEMLEGQSHSGDGSWTARGNYSRDPMSRRMSRRDSYADNSMTNDWYIGEGYSQAEQSMKGSIEAMMKDPRLSYEDRETLKRANRIMNM